MTVHKPSMFNYKLHGSITKLAYKIEFGEVNEWGYICYWEDMWICKYNVSYLWCKSYEDSV